VVKLLLGLVKGLVIGAAVGYGAFQADLVGGWNWVTYGVVGALVGLLVGRPIWRNILDKEATSWVSVLKAAFGFGVGVGVYALVAKAWGGGSAFEVSFLSDGSHRFQDWQPIFGAALGAVYGGFVELDDSLDDDKSKTKKLPEPAKIAAKK
jgi:hypothetical protein